MLETYNTERAPGRPPDHEAPANQSIADTGRIVAALDVDDTTNVNKLNRQLALRKAPGPEGEKIRERPARGHRVQGVRVRRARRGAQPPVRVPRPSSPTARRCPRSTRDPELYAQATTWPGAKLPHTWITRAGRRVSTLDLAGHGAFSVWTGIGGQAWLDAAEAFSAETGVPVALVSVGPGRTQFEDPYGTWAELREISDGGVLLVHPLVRRGPARELARLPGGTAAQWLRQALASVLGTSPPA